MKGDQIDRDGWSVYLKYTQYNIDLISWLHKDSVAAIKLLRIKSITFMVRLIHQFEGLHKFWDVTEKFSI